MSRGTASGVAPGLFIFPARKTLVQAGKELAASLTRACKAARQTARTRTQLGYG